MTIDFNDTTGVSATTNMPYITAGTEFDEMTYFTQSPFTYSQTGARGYHFGNAIRMKDAVGGCPDSVLCMGNVKPGTFVFGTPREIYQETRQIMEECGGHPNFVISSGCDIPPIAKWENIDSFYQAAASCGG